MATLFNPERYCNITTLSGLSHTESEARLHMRMCLLEAAAYVAGEPHSDHPQCVNPVLGNYGRCLNDSFRASETELRTRLLLPVIPLLIGTEETSYEDVALFLVSRVMHRIVPIGLRANDYNAEADQFEALPDLTPDNRPYILQQVRDIHYAIPYGADSYGAGSVEGSLFHLTEAIVELTNYPDISGVDACVAGNAVADMFVTGDGQYEEVRRLQAEALADACRIR